MSSKTLFEQGRLAGRFEEALDNAARKTPLVSKEKAAPPLDPEVERKLRDQGVNPK